ncbi:AsmA-like C-terminal domain-containing protein [Campylobacter sp. MG1]|uniref:AsmA-like C-terminal domain-containing protein n=1 Tax=Campylobacter sp. MG1 TaxID=2976332 RepID=UPI00226C9FB5|nr:AsmA-like C-terminal domain-containing protein [Campylobacter sp. MG1]
MKKTSKPIKKILKIAFAFIALILTFVLILINGISIDKLSIFNISINNFSLKLDKKLTLNIDEVYIKKANNENSLTMDDIKKTILNLKKYKKVLLLFSKIDIHNIINNENNFKIFYNQKILKISANDLNLNISIDLYSKELVANINTLQYKNLNFTGNVIFNKLTKINGKLTTTNDDFSVDISLENIKNDINLNLKNIIINNKNSSLALIKEYMPPILDEWIINRVQFDKFTGNFTISIKNNELDGIFGDGSFTNVNARYNDKAPIAYADNIKITMKKYSLLIDGENLKSQGNLKADIFKLYIENILKPDVLINIEAKNTLYNNEVEKIINAFGVSLGINQTSGNSDAKIQILLNNNHTHNINIIVNSNGSYKYKNFAFDAKNVNINIKDKIINITGNLNAKNINANNVSVILDTNSNIGNINIKKLKINYDDYFNYNDEANFDLNLNTKMLTFKNINTDIILQNDAKIKIELDKILKYSKKLQEYNFQNGELELFNKDNAFFINITNATFDLNLYKNKNFKTIEEAKIYINSYENKYTKDDFYISIYPEKTKVDTKSTNLNVVIDKDNTNINVNNMLILTNDMNNNSNENLILILNNSQIIYNDFLLNFKKLKINKNNEIKIRGELLDNSTIVALIKNDILQAYIRNLQGTTLNNIISKNIFNTGTIDIDLSGKNMNDFNGLINIKDASLAHTKNYVNLLAIIDSIPSLITINKPNFTKTGLGIKLGSIEFTKKNDFIDINNINILGYSIDANGKGSIDIKNNYANITTNIFTLKGTNKIIGNIPIVKEIVIGEKNNKIATQLKITGKLDDLKFQTSIAKDIITSPFNLIKNIITLPKNLLDF